MNQKQSSENEAAEEDAEVYSSQKEVSGEEWLWVGASAAVLILGLFVAMIYKRW